MKLLTFAHRGEAQAFLSAYSFTPVDFYFDGLLKSNDYYLLITGEGPHSASEKTISVLAKFSDEISHVYNLGVAGSLNPLLLKYEILWIRTAYAHHAEKCEFKSFSSYEVKSANDCITAFSRVLNLFEKKKLSHFANIVDRELWAVASAANLFKKPYSALKIISDEMVEDELGICKFVKEEALLYSEKMLAEFQKQQGEKIQKTITAKSDTPFFNDSAFYFTTSQARKLNSTLDGLRLKGLALESLLIEPTIISIKDLDLLPKERTRLLLEFLSEKLNPISVKIKASIQNSLSSLHDAKILTLNDPEFEESWLNLSMKIQSSRDLEKIKNALKIFSYEDFKKIFDGNFDV